MNNVISFESGRQAPLDREHSWDEQVAMILGEAGVWPEDMDGHINGLKSKLLKGTSPADAADSVLKKLGWRQGEDPFFL